MTVKFKEIKGSHNIGEIREQIDSLITQKVNILISFKSRKKKINNVMNRDI